jgi:hypothetical protein
MRRTVARVCAAAGTLAAVGLVACGSSEAVQTATSGAASGPSAPTGPCGAVTQEFPIEGETHVPICSYVDYHTLPPSSGNHYPIWAAYMTYDQPVPEGYWVHNLEHGSIVITYNCGEAGCAGDIAAAQQMMNEFPSDSLCTSEAMGVEHRLVMTPDPRLDVRFAASAWGWTLRANCFDADAFRAFAQAHYGNGPEVLCDQGEDVIGTASGDPAGCGEASDAASDASDAAPSASDASDAQGP